MPNYEIYVTLNQKLPSYDVYTFIILNMISVLIQTNIGFGGRKFMRQNHKEDSKHVKDAKD